MRATARTLLNVIMAVLPIRKRLRCLSRAAGRLEVVDVTTALDHEREIGLLERHVVDGAGALRSLSALDHAAQRDPAVRRFARDYLELPRGVRFGGLRHGDLDDLARGETDELRRRAAKLDPAAVQEREIGAPGAEIGDDMRRQDDCAVSAEIGHQLAEPKALL